jgi:hypothetical protein
LAYTERLKDAEEAARTLTDIQFELKEATLINRIEISEARQELEKFRLASRDSTATDKERYESQLAAIEQVKILRQEREDELDLRQQEIDAMVEAAAGSADLYEARLKQHELDRERVELGTSMIMLENTLTERLNTLLNAYNKSIEASRQQAQAADILNGITVNQTLSNDQLTQSLIKKNEEVQKGTDATLANTDAQDGYNVTLQNSYGILNQMVNLFKNFNFSSLISLIFSGLQIAGSFVSGGATSFIGKFLGFEKGGVIPYAKGGVMVGPSHNQGGIKYALGGRTVELEGGEGVINKKSMSLPWVRDLASQLNQVGGGVKFASGGVTPSQTAIEAQTARLEQVLKQRETVVVTEDIQQGLNTVNVEQNISSI